MGMTLRMPHGSAPCFRDNGWLAVALTLAGCSPTSSEPQSRSRSTSSPISGSQVQRLKRCFGKTECRAGERKRKPDPLPDNT